ncbi:MAG: membrane protein insertion efficiency factor YidD [Candidatus Xiphinematobacter sp.]|nr:MAG: membrane protein insertion efficiency factor YidD [Candidatus Xiphinematobacter sp.]QQY10932.1 MAG: membrane protein insertion efficiency factor YidD [Candidatus Xiphinematobacter sp.]QQY10993.1 MAG: membrane protein insertion efficiency factor YidD [Candidatus Xiphinematobacter sp.]
MRKFLFLLPLNGYRFLISPCLHILVGPGYGCRFEPTCSRYAMEAIWLHGFLRGSMLALSRICKCHPWGGWGYDPIPELHPEAPVSKLHGP